jgi:hypothetical protein
LTEKPNPIPKELVDVLLESLPAGLVDNLAEFIHDSWWEEKRSQGFHHPSEIHAEWNPKNPKLLCDKCHLDMIPYDQLPESSKRFDWVTIKNVLAGVRVLGYHVHPNRNRRGIDIEAWREQHASSPGS